MPVRPYIFFPLALLFLGTHLVALHFSLYWFVWWFDILMHTWGGYLVVYGLMMVGTQGSGVLRLPRSLLFPTLLCVMVAWEVFEYMAGLTGTEANYVSDTAADFLCGTVGGMVAYLTTRVA